MFAYCEARIGLRVVKRLLGLSYLWTGSINGIKLQVWVTWLFYAVLIDLADAVADELSLPFDPFLFKDEYSRCICCSILDEYGVIESKNSMGRFSLLLHDPFLDLI